MVQSWSLPSSSSLSADALETGEVTTGECQNSSVAERDDLERRETILLS